MSLVTYELDEHIATITLNRPEARNAINGAVRTELNGAWERFRDEEEAWVGILAANGDVFCAGGDLKDGEGSVGPLRGPSGRSRPSTPSKAVWSCSSRPSPLSRVRASDTV